MALVITLILLSVTLIMAVAFLAISRRERNAVTTTTDTATARLAADAALANAEAQIVANMFASSNAAAYNFGLLVSTNYINAYGFVPAGGANPTNVNYYDSTGNPLTGDNLIQNIANLFYLPRAPVLVSSSDPLQGRFYLDLNRNGVDDPNGSQPQFDASGLYIHTDGTVDSTSPVNVLTNFMVGDPEWIGMLDHPDTPHGPNNLFVSRYAFIAMPVGNTLDLNAIHNQVFDQPTAPSPGTVISVNPGASIHDGFFRNEGVGSWEINLAAFLADLNTNEWGQVIGAGGLPPLSANYYQYNEAPFGTWSGGPNFGDAFDDARALLAYRYTNNYNSLLPVYSALPPSLFGPNADYAFLNDNIDGYSDGPLMISFQTPGDNDNPQLPWAGADNPNQFFSLPSDLFNPTKAFSFSTNLLYASTNRWGGTTNSTYDRYTFYRMLDQLGSDSTPESGQLNLNYSNAVVQTDFNGVVTNLAIIPGAETNFVTWTATNFFMAAADQMLRLYTTNWFLSSISTTNPFTTLTNSYLATYYGLIYTNPIILDQSGQITGLTNAPLWGMTNQIPAFGIADIPIMINSNFVYSPAVNRLLQLAANIYDAVYYTNHYFPVAGSYSTPYLPSVFRPIFDVTNEYNFNGVLSKDVYVCGFSEVNDVYTDPDQPLSVPWNISNPTVLGNLAYGIHSGLSAVNVFGVPMIIGAKKGFPNFNEFYMESAFQLTRKLMITRQSTNLPSPAPPPTDPFWGYYVEYNLSVSNQFAAECWNSYSSNYTRPLDIYATNFLVMTLTNDENNFNYMTNLTAGAWLFFPNSTNSSWPGYTNIYPQLAPGSFQIPLMTNFAAVPASRYLFNGGSPYLSTNLSLWYELTPTGFGPYPIPHWGLTVTNNLQVAMVDHNSGRLIDYVQLRGPNSVRDLTTEIMSGYDTASSGNNTGYNDLWDTNQVNGIPNGFAWQFNVSQGNGIPQWSQALWGDQQTAYDQMNAFIAFTTGPGAIMLTYPGYVPHPDEIAAALMTNAMQMAYPASAMVVQDIDWQVNDPLVHYMASDLVNPATSTFIAFPFAPYNSYIYADNFLTQPGSGFQIILKWPGYLGKVTPRYQPWNILSTGVGTNLLAIKDPLVTCSDDWNFPTNKFPTVGWLGRVHRGTPWQTVYLKNADVLSYQNNFGGFGPNGPSLWANWTGNTSPFDVTNTAPKKDWLLFDLFTTAFDDNATRGALSVNVAGDKSDPMAGLAAWSALFSGVMVLSNNASDTAVQAGFQTASSMTNYIAFPISPAGPDTNSALSRLVQGIYSTRTNFANPDGVKGVFEHAGYILSVPQLTTQSPFLNWNDSVQYNRGISDEMYEWLPQQVMSLLRCSASPRYVIYCYGQALKPAPNSLVTSGTYFGMCTNYQVVAESAVRAVIRVDGANTPTPHVVVESYNPLPPD